MKILKSRNLNENEYSAKMTFRLYTMSLKSVLLILDFGSWTCVWNLKYKKCLFWASLVILLLEPQVYNIYSYRAMIPCFYGYDIWVRFGWVHVVCVCCVTFLFCMVYKVYDMENRASFIIIHSKYNKYKLWLNFAIFNIILC